MTEKNDIIDSIQLAYFPRAEGRVQNLICKIISNFNSIAKSIRNSDNNF